MNEKQLVVLCGLIGSGKTTFAIQHYPNFTDFDAMPEGSQKIHQIQWTERLLSKYNEVCHITCFPTPVEWEFFKTRKCIFLWIDTSLDQAKTNILIRGRERDMNNLFSVLEANKRILHHRKMSTIPFRTINIFPRG